MSHIVSDTCTCDICKGHLKVLAYAKSLRNTSKRWYAQTYGLAMVYGHDSAPRPADLSFMAAQAVELHIERLLLGVSHA